MRFTNPKRRQPPPVIIISLIDVLIIMLIFLMVTTTFKQQPAIKITLPDSKQAGEGVSEERLVVSIPKAGEPGASYYLGAIPVTLERLQEELGAYVRKYPQAVLNIRADTDAPFGKVVNVLNAAKVAGIRTTMPVYTRVPGQP